MGTVDAWQAKLESWVGTVENPRGSNRTFICDEFGRVGSMDYYAWCMATQWLALNQTGTALFKTASVGFGIDAAKRGVNGASWVPADGEARRGDLACWDYGPHHGKPKGRWDYFHVNGVINPSVQSRFECIGGNESDSVRRAWHTRSYLQGFIRPAYSLAPPVPEEEPEVAKSVIIQGVTRPASTVNGIDEQVGTFLWDGDQSLTHLVNAEAVNTAKVYGGNTPVAGKLNYSYVKSLCEKFA